MSRRLPLLKPLPAFVLAARLGSFSAAAKELNLTHGAVSRQIKALEGHLGVRLFRRLTHRLALTPEGAVFHAQVHTALDLLESAADAVTHRRPRTPVVLAAVPSFAMRWLIPRLEDFTARHPEVELRLADAVAGDRPRPGRFDIVLAALDAAGGRGAVEYEALDLFAELVGPVLSPAVLERQPLTDPGDLRHHILLQAETRPNAWADWLKATGTAGIATGDGPRFDHHYYLLQAAASGLGVAVTPLALVEEDLAAGRLVAPFGFRPSGRRYAALSVMGSDDQPAIRAVLAWLREQGQATTLHEQAMPPVQGPATGAGGSRLSTRPSSR